MPKSTKKMKKKSTKKKLTKAQAARFKKIVEMGQSIVAGDEAVQISDQFKGLFENIEKKILFPEDTFPFDGAKCITDCDGRCCINIDVMINPYDVYRIVTSEWGQQLGLTDTTKLVSGDDPFIVIYLGHISGVPQAMINFREVIPDVRVCPFAALVKVATSEDIESGKLDDLPFLQGKGRLPNHLCALEFAKPTICRASPLGRIIDMGKNGAPHTHYILSPPAADCKCVQTEKRVKVADYIRKWSLDEYYRESAKYHTFLRHLVPSANIPEVLRILVGQILFNFDAAAVKAGQDPAAVRPTYDKILETAQDIVNLWAKWEKKFEAARDSVNPQAMLMEIITEITAKMTFEEDLKRS